MRRIIVLIVVTVIVTACGVKERMSSSNVVTEETSLLFLSADNTSRISSVTEIKDSVVAVAAPIENSSTAGLQRSFLKTSLAYSEASIDTCGLLHHYISNYDTIMSKMVVKRINDTVYIDKIVTKTEHHVKRGETDRLTVVETNKLTRRQSFQVWFGRLALVIVVVYLIIRRYGAFSRRN